MSVALEILDILMNSGCMQYARNFAGLTLEKFYLYTWKDLKRTLPADVVDGEELARRIESEILIFRTKAALQSAANEEEEDDLTIVKVITKADRVQEAEQVIESDSDNDGNNNNDDEEEEEGGDPEPNFDDYETRDIKSELREIVLNPSEPGSMSDHQNVTRKSRVHGVIATANSIIEPHTCSTDDIKDEGLSKWKEYFTSWAPYLQSLEMNTWTWAPFASDCPFNLFKILTRSDSEFVHLTRLIINSNISTSSDPNEDSIEIFGSDFTLPHLKIIKIAHQGNLDFEIELREILRVTVNLEVLEYSNDDPASLESYLRILKNLSNTLPFTNLKVISLKSLSGNGYLTSNHLVTLSSINVKELEKLELGTGLYEDVKDDSFQKIFKQFPKMKVLKIQGCFLGHSTRKPNITIQFPPLPNMRMIDIGSDYEFTSCTGEEEIQEPPKKKKKSDDSAKEQEMTNGSTPNQLKPFPVNLKFSSLPKLTVMKLGNLFNIEPFNFSSMPRLEEFRVGSRWDLSVTYPSKTKNGNIKNYPKIKSLQLPDNLQDPTCLQQLALRFPNLTKVWIFLPTVHVLRTFCKIMEKSMLEDLFLQIQFDFESTLNSCLLSKPSEIEVTKREKEKIKFLKEYQHWGDFVKMNHVQIPPENFKSLETDRMAGLDCLPNLKYLEIEHIPRVMKIPRGPLHWTSPHCYFSEETIGFLKYPWPEHYNNLKDYFKQKSSSMLSIRFVGFDGPVKFLQGQVYMRSKSIKMNPTGMQQAPKKEEEKQM